MSGRVLVSGAPVGVFHHPHPAPGKARPRRPRPRRRRAHHLQRRPPLRPDRPRARPGSTPTRCWLGSGRAARQRLLRRHARRAHGRPLRPGEGDTPRCSGRTGCPTRRRSSSGGPRDPRPRAGGPGRPGRGPAGSRAPPRRDLAQPVSNDDAIPLLMARHVLQGELATILWNQPYNGTLDAYLLAPASAAGLARTPRSAPTRRSARCCWSCRGPAGPPSRRARRAGWLAALLAAVGTPYMALMAATGPTPNFLVPLLWPCRCAWRDCAGLDGRRAVAGAALAPRPRLGPGGLGLRPCPAAAASGSASGCGRGAAAAPRPCAAFAAGVARWRRRRSLLARAVGAAAASPVTALRPRWLWLAGLRTWPRAAAGLFGLQVPLVVDGPERAACPSRGPPARPRPSAARRRRGGARRRAWPLLGWAAALVRAFASSRRTGGDEIRYLYGLARAAARARGRGPGARWRRAGRCGRGAGLAVARPLGSSGTARCARAWRDPEHAARVWEVPPLEPVLDTLRARACAARTPASSSRAGSPWSRAARSSPARPGTSACPATRCASATRWTSTRAGVGALVAPVAGDAARGRIPRAAGRPRRELRARTCPAISWSSARFSPPFDEARAVPAAQLAVPARSTAAAARPRCSIATAPPPGRRPSGSRPAPASPCGWPRPAASPPSSSPWTWSGRRWRCRGSARWTAPRWRPVRRGTACNG